MYDCFRYQIMIGSSIIFFLLFDMMVLEKKTTLISQSANPHTIFLQK